MAFGYWEYMFGKDSGIRKTEKVLQKPGIGASFTSECWNSIWRPNVMRQDKQWQTMIQMNQEYGIQTNEISRLGELCATLTTTVMTKVWSYVTTASLTLSVCSVLLYPLCKVGIWCLCLSLFKVDQVFWWAKSLSRHLVWDRLVSEEEVGLSRSKLQNTELS